MPNWKAMQVPADKLDKKIRVAPQGVKSKYLSMGSWHASLSKEGACRKPLKSSYSAAAKPKK